MSEALESLVQQSSLENNLPNAGEPVMLQYFDYSDDDGPIGDHWKRITSEADQISEAGFNGVWVQSPAEPNTPASNGYNPRNLLNWDSFLGTEEEFDEMLEELKQEDLELYIDGILNHTGSEDPEKADYPLDESSFHDADAVGRTESQLCGLWSLDHTEPEVMDYIKDFIDLAEQKGVDGYRWDAVKHIPKWVFDDYVNEWISENSFTVGEAYDDNMDLLRNYIDTGMNLFDFPLFFRLKNGFSSWGDIRAVSAAVDSENGLEQSILAQNSYRSSTFVENHDVDSPEKEKLAHAFMLTAPGYPTVYSNHAEDEEGVDYTEEWLTDLIDIKRNLASGEMTFHRTHKPRDVMVFSRDNYSVGINKSDDDYVADLQKLWDANYVVDLTSGEINPGEEQVIPENDYIVCSPVKY